MTSILFTRVEEFNKIELTLDFGKKRDIKFTLRGGSYSCSTKGLDDKTHDRVSKIWKDYATRSTLRVPPLIKFNQLENLARSCNDLGSFLIKFTEHNLYQQPQALPKVVEVVTLPKLKTSKKEFNDMLEAGIGKNKRKVTARANLTELAGAMPATDKAMKPKADRKPVPSIHINDLTEDSHPIAKANAESWKAIGKNKKSPAEAKPKDDKAATGAKYEYPEGMSADDKKKFRAAARAKAKKEAK